MGGVYTQHRMFDVSNALHDRQPRRPIKFRWCTRPMKRWTPCQTRDMSACSGSRRIANASTSPTECTWHGTCDIARVEATSTCGTALIAAATVPSLRVSGSGTTCCMIPTVQKSHFCSRACYCCTILGCLCEMFMRVTTCG